ncbi:hypothetical protein OIY81_3174 [Cryptosporidium canis]|uniref:Uncharacterized protein n=1 Tax=Cryptosporidium canis TaxID=195482 RepID=A0ABQ8P485_9CRYT|nr:hypothetical protein OJ252_3170 [Cryptosporidium canis]KAJ1606555.1 hypothetical protein OIY81_3174 [Cryptosporidium canis]
MRHFFSINRIFPNICIDTKFCLNHVFDLIEDQHTHHRILNAIYILSIDLGDDTNLDSVVAINEFIKLISQLLELEKMEDEQEFDSNLTITTFLDVFFLLKYPINCHLIKLIDSNIGDLKLSNFWVLRQLTNELYQCSRESNRIYEMDLYENRHNENFLLQDGEIIHRDTSNDKPDNFIEGSMTNKVFEYKRSIKVGIPSFLDFESDFNENKRINFFYINDDVDTAYKNAVFSFSLRNERLDNLFITLKRYQNKYQYNPISILIYRLLIYRYSDFGDNIANPLIQFLENSKSETLVNSLFECSLFIQDEELHEIFDFYNILERSDDFQDVVLMFNGLIRNHMKNFPSLNKFLPWIRAKENDQIFKFGGRHARMNFLNTFEMVKFYLNYLKTELLVISSKLKTLVLLLKENVDHNNLELALNNIKKLIFKTPIFDRNNILSVLCELFSIKLNENLYLDMGAINKFSDSVLVQFSSSLEFKEQTSDYSLEQTTGEALQYTMSGISNALSLKNLEFSLKDDWFLQCFRDIRLYSLRLLINSQCYDFYKELLLVLKALTKSQQLTLWWYLNVHDAPFIYEFVSMLFKERRRVGAIQCYIKCMEIELASRTINTEYTTV